MKVYGWNMCIAPPILPRHCMEVGGQFHAPIYTRGRNLRNWVRPRDGEDVLEERRFSCPCQHSTAHILLYPSYSTFVCQTDRLAVTLCALQAAHPLMFALSQVPRTFCSMLCLPAS